MPKVIVGDVPFKEAIAFFKKKVKIPTENWDDMLGDIHAKAFTVAGATNIDVLTDIHKAVESALENGTTITEFRKAFDKTVQKNGWSYKGKRGWRTRIIYDTNLRTAHMAGKWEQFQRVKATRPYLQYLTVGDSRVRPQHAAWNKTTLPVDDDWFITHYPPNGWGCRCTVRSLSESQLKRQGLSVNKAPKVNKSRRFNTETGQDYGLVPEGIDVGWDYNVGKAWLGPDLAFGKKAIDLPGVIRKSVLSDSTQFAAIIERPFKKWVEQVFLDKHPRGNIRIVGYLSDPILLYLHSIQKEISNSVISISDERLRHIRRENKKGEKKNTRTEGKDISIPEEDLARLPQHISSPDAVVWDKNKNNLLYIFDPLGVDKKAKIAINVEFNHKGVISNNIRTGSLIELQTLKDEKSFFVIQGKI